MRPFCAVRAPLNQPGSDEVVRTTRPSRSASMADASCAPYEIDDQHNHENDHQRSDTDVHETSLSRPSLPGRPAFETMLSVMASGAASGGRELCSSVQNPARAGTDSPPVAVRAGAQKSRTTRSRYVARSCRSAADQEDNISAMSSSAAARYASDARRPFDVSPTMPARPSVGSAFRRTWPLSTRSPTSRLMSGASSPVSLPTSEERTSPALRSAARIVTAGWERYTPDRSDRSRAPSRPVAMRATRAIA